LIAGVLGAGLADRLRVPSLLLFLGIGMAIGDDGLDLVSLSDTHLIQGLAVAADEPTGSPAEPLWARVARRATAWGPGGTVGLVVGATAPAELAAARSIAPGLAFLVPGVGAQGGDVAAVLADGPALVQPAGGRPGGGLLVNVSRGIAQAALGEPGPGVPADPGERLAAAAAEWARRLPVLP